MAMDLQDLFAKYQFFNCLDCGRVFYGGKAACDIAAEERPDAVENAPKGEHFCADCGHARQVDKLREAGLPTTSGPPACEQHGAAFIAYKCKFCCSVACWFCWGTTHFCEPCHRRAGSNVLVPCPGPPKCAGKHLPPGQEMCLGCVLCSALAQ